METRANGAGYPTSRWRPCVFQITPAGGARTNPSHHARRRLACASRSPTRRPRDSRPLRRGVRDSEGQRTESGCGEGVEPRQDPGADHHVMPGVGGAQSGASGCDGLRRWVVLALRGTPDALGRADAGEGLRPGASAREGKGSAAVAVVACFPPEGTRGGPLGIVVGSARRLSRLLLPARDVDRQGGVRAKRNQHARAGRGPASRAAR